MEMLVNQFLYFWMEDVLNPRPKPIPAYILRKRLREKIERRKQRIVLVIAKGRAARCVSALSKRRQKLLDAVIHDLVMMTFRPRFDAEQKRKEEYRNITPDPGRFDNPPVNQANSAPDIFTGGEYAEEKDHLTRRKTGKTGIMISPKRDTYWK
ncbi:MAG: hypothetical protein ABSF66_00845 [Terriglobales bacterium]